MDTRVTALILFACVFGSGMYGFFLGKVLPDPLLDSDSKDIVKLATGLIATLSALVLGLLISSAKGTFDQVNNELTQAAAKVVLLNRALAQYGPETDDIRAGHKRAYAAVMDRLISGNAR
jgi:CDP-diglyceride synthetase